MICVKLFIVLSSSNEQIFLKTCKIGRKGLLMRVETRQLSKRILLVLGVVFAVGLLIFINVQRTAIHDILTALYLIPQPERLTELYFENGANLSNIPANSNGVSFSFVVHNLEAADYHYTYNVSVYANGTKHVVDSGNILVKDNQYYVKAEKLALTNVSGGQEIIVELTNKQQMIDFWVGK